MTTWGSAHRNADGEVVEVTSDLPRYKDVDAELRAAIATVDGAGCRWPFLIGTINSRRQHAHSCSTVTDADVPRHPNQEEGMTGHIAPGVRSGSI